MPIRSTRLAAALAALLLMACGDDGGSAVDGGQDQRTLEVLDPPGDSIGLAFGGAETLRVRYLDREGEPVDRAFVEFTIVAAGSETVGGSTLSSPSAVTGSDGIAEVGLVAGAEGAGFRVQASAAGASPAIFFVSVSNDGFTRLVVTPEHSGPRLESELPQVELRLYRDGELSCSDVDPDALPASVLPPRSLDGYGNTAVFPNVASKRSYVLVAWGSVSVGARPLAFGCVELSDAQTRNLDVTLTVDTPDRPVEMPSASEVELVLDLESTLDADAEAPWMVLGCPLGAGQLLLDCVADALVSDGDLDCDFTGSSALATSIRAQRGAVDGNGCRPATLSGGGPSLDKRLSDAVAMGDTFPTGASLTSLTATRSALARELILRTRLRIAGGAAEHSLSRAVFGNAELDLVQSSRLVVSQGQIATSWTPMGSSSPEATLSEHGFTLDLDALSRDLFSVAALDDLQLSSAALGTELAASAESGALTGCTAVSSVICTTVGQAAACASAACTSARGYLDVALTEWWQRLAGDGVDFTVSGALFTRDTNGDLDVDVIGGDILGEPSTSMSATLVISTGTVEVPITAASPVP